MARSSTSFLAVLGALAAACGPTVIVTGEAADSTGAGAASGAGPVNGAGATSGAGPNGGAGAASSGGGAGAGMPGPPRWAEAFGADGQQHLRGLASSPTGDLFLTGSFDGTLSFGAAPLAQAGPRSGYVAKLDAAGKAVWARALTGSDCASAAVAADPLGDLLVTGSVQGALKVGGTAAGKGDGIFVLRLDAGGGLVWAATFGTSAGPQPDRGIGVAVTPAGTVVVTGAFHGAVDFGGGPLDGGSGSVFAVALDAAAHHLWSRRFDGVEAFVAAGAAGHVLVAINGAGGVMTAVDLDAAGAPGWSHSYPSGSFRAVAANAAGDALFTGLATGVDFGGGALPDPLPNGQAFVVALDPLGHHLWSLGLPFDKHQSAGVALTVTSAGHPAVTGSYVHALASSAVMQSTFLVELDAGGAPVKSETFGPIDGIADGVSQEGWGLAPAAAGGLYVAGDFYGAIDVAGQTLAGAGSADIFVARLPP